MPSLVFVVEDDHDIARLVRYHLERAEYGVRTFLGAEKVVSEAEKTAPALFLLDIMLPGGYSGLDLCRYIRRTETLSHTPVIFLTAKCAESDRLQGFELGADDYIVKPFSPRELVSRVKAVLRRSEPTPAGVRITAGDVEIDTGAMTVRVRGAIAATTTTEFRLLEHLARRPGQVFTRDQLLNAVWTESQYISERSVDVYVRKLREKIEREPESPVLLKTVRGVGYRFDLPKPLPAEPRPFAATPVTEGIT